MRAEVGDLLRRYGQPILHLHRYNVDDAQQGVAVNCPACFDSIYENTRANCPVCFNIGFVSRVTDPTHWITTSGDIVTTPTDTPAPLHGGFAEPTLTWVIKPDAPIDVFKLDEAGMLTRIQQAEGHAYFDPTMGNNDLIVEIVLSQDGNTIVDVGERNELHSVTQQTIRGWGKRTHFRNHVIGQMFQMNLIPSNNPYMGVPLGVDYGDV